MRLRSFCSSIAVWLQARVWCCGSGWPTGTHATGTLGIDHAEHTLLCRTSRCALQRNVAQDSEFSLRETLENQRHPRENGAVIAGQYWIDGR